MFFYLWFQKFTRQSLQILSLFLFVFSTSLFLILILKIIYVDLYKNI